MPLRHSIGMIHNYVTVDGWNSARLVMMPINLWRTSAINSYQEFIARNFAGFPGSCLQCWRLHSPSQEFYDCKKTWPTWVTLGSFKTHPTSISNSCTSLGGVLNPWKVSKLNCLIQILYQIRKKPSITEAVCLFDRWDEQEQPECFGICHMAFGSDFPMCILWEWFPD